jgi:hypothetical protein
MQVPNQPQKAKAFGRCPWSYLLAAGQSPPSVCSKGATPQSISAVASKTRKFAQVALANSAASGECPVWSWFRSLPLFPLPLRAPTAWVAVSHLRGGGFAAFVCFDNNEFPFPVNAGTNWESVEMVVEKATFPADS